MQAWHSGLPPRRHGLARGGRSIIVGRGGVFITRDLPGGIHVLLVAPFEQRVQHMACRRELSGDEARKLVRDIDQNRQAFYRRYWPKQGLTAEAFTITLNAALMTDEQMVGAILPLVPAPSASESAPAATAP